MTVWIETDLCDGCKRCVKACPYGAIDFKEGKAAILEQCTSCGACVDVCKNSAIETDAAPREIPDFSNRQGVWVFAEQRGGKLAKVSLELLGKARELAQELDQEVSAVLLGRDVAGITETLITYGAQKVYLADHPALENFRSEPYTDVLSTILQEQRPNILLIGATHIGRDLAPRVAHKVGVGLTADCTELSIEPDEKILLQIRPAFGGNIMATIVNRFSRPQMATVRPGVMEACEMPGNDGTIVSVEVSLDEAAIGTQILEIIKEKEKTGDLSQAKVVVAGGRGVRDADGFAILKELAEVMDGEVAGTRVAVEEGWIPVSMQVGQTGQTVRPEIYIACGISGAIQHRAGMMNSRYIIAINNDANAPIFKVADWSIVGDIFDIVPEMIKKLKAGTNQLPGI